MNIEVKEEKKVPKRVFIVPYRNRVQHKFFFSKYMSFILEDSDDYEIYFSHQCDARTFNRGATKNIGFLAVKEKYPEHYKNITFIFNLFRIIPASFINRSRSFSEYLETFLISNLLYAFLKVSSFFKIVSQLKPA